MKEEKPAKLFHVSIHECMNKRGDGSTCRFPQFSLGGKIGSRDAARPKGPMQCPQCYLSCALRGTEVPTNFQEHRRDWTIEKLECLRTKALKHYQGNHGFAPSSSSAPVRQPTAAKSRPASPPAGLQLAPATVSQTQTLSIDEKMRRAEEAECRAKSTCSNHTTEPADDATDDATEPSSAEFGG